MLRHPSYTSALGTSLRPSAVMLMSAVKRQQRTNSHCSILHIVECDALRHVPGSRSAVVCETSGHGLNGVRVTSHLHSRRRKMTMALLL